MFQIFSIFFFFFNESAVFRPQRQRENPNVIGMALAVHHDTRNKKMVDLLNALGYCVVQKMTKKPATVVTVKDLSECFNDRVLSL